jgi:hypothetical protein
MSVHRVPEVAEIEAATQVVSDTSAGDAGSLRTLLLLNGVGYRLKTGLGLRRDIAPLFRNRAA